MIRSGQIILDPHGSGSFKQTIGFLLVYIYLYFRILTECQVNQTAVRQLVISTVQPIQAHAVKVMCTQQGFGQCSGAATFFGRLGTSEVPEPTPASANWGRLRLQAKKGGSGSKYKNLSFWALKKLPVPVPVVINKKNLNHICLYELRTDFLWFLLQEQGFSSLLS